jgi:hypothetical protein
VTAQKTAHGGSVPVGLPRVLLGALVALPTCAIAAPPPVGSDDYRLLMPYANALNQARTRDGGLCCSVADGSVVDARIAGDRWQVRFLNRRFPDAPKGWIDVPPEAVNRTWFNPTGLPIAWWYGGAIRCFSPAGGV